MKPKRKKPWETKLIEKIIDVINYYFPGEEKIALEKFKKEKSEEISLMPSKMDFARGFQAWFLLDYLIKDEFTPMEFISANPEKYFTKKEIKMINKFINNERGFYEILDITNNKKDYILKNVMNKKVINVKTIDFPAKLKAGEFIYAVPVEKLGGNYFFYGNVASYSKEEGQKVMDYLIKESDKINKEDKK